MFNVLDFVIDRNIEYWTEGKNVSQGWINICCPFCDDIGNHGGFNLREDYYNCWKCGYHSIFDVIMEVDDCTFFESKKTFEKYTLSNKNEIKKKKTSTSIKFPLGTGELKEIHKRYLEKRNFDCDKIEKMYDLKGTMYLSTFKYRIIAPIYYQNQLVSYQGRDVTGKTDIRYKNCPVDQEVIQHKHILYDIDNAKNDNVVVVEGITDCWRLGHNAISTFGIKFTFEQIMLLKNRFKKVFIIFDNDNDARIQAKNLGTALSTFSVKVEDIDIGENDVGDLNNDDAKYLMKDLGF